MGQERLAALQQEPDSPEALAAIPHVQLSDLPRDPAPIPTETEADGRLTSMPCRPTALCIRRPILQPMI